MLSFLLSLLLPLQPREPADSVTDLPTTPTASLTHLMDGRFPGVEVIPDHRPGGSADIIIRGGHSLLDHRPLIVVDGVPDALLSLSDIDPESIASISIIKDAFSAVAYGPYAGNGVISITTKRQQNERPEVSASVSAGVALPVHAPRLMNADQYIGYMSWLPEMENPGPGRDWFSELTRPALLRGVHLSAGQCTKGGLGVRGHVAYNGEDGVVKASSHHRLTAHLNMDLPIRPWLDAGGSAMVSARKEDRPAISFYGGRDGLFCPPIENISIPVSDFADPVACLENTSVRNHYLSCFGNFFVSSRPVAGLTLKASVAPTLNLYELADFRTLNYTEEDVLLRGNNDLYRSMRRMSVAEEVQAAYRGEIANKHWLEAYVQGYFSQRSSAYHRVWRYQTSQMEPQQDDISPRDWGVYENRVYARASYGFQDWLRLDVGGTYCFIRYGGPSLSPKDLLKWSSFFPSASIHWDVRQTFSRWRASDLLSRWNVYASFGRIPVARPDVDHLLETETLLFMKFPVDRTDSFDWGTDLSFLRDRIRLSVAGYYALSGEVFLYKLPVGFFYPDIFISNSGAELSLSTLNVDTPRLRWRTRLTASHNTQKVKYATGLPRAAVPGEDLPPEKEYEFSCIYGSFPSEQYTMLRPGYAVNAYWGFQYEGVWDSADEFIANKDSKTYASGSRINEENCAGQPKFRDVDHNGLLDLRDQVYLGKADPVIHGGLQNQFQFGNWDIDVMFTYALGGKMLNYSEVMWATSTMNQYSYMAEEGSPVYSSMSGSKPVGSFAVHNASWLRLRSLSVKYSFHFPRKRSVLTLGVTGENLFLLTGYKGVDPLASQGGIYYQLRVEQNPWIRARSFAVSLRYDL